MADEFDAGRGATAILFGIALLAFFGFGVVSGPLSDRYGPRPVVAVGGAMMVGGLLATAQTTNLWVGCLTYGLGVGIGAGCFGAPLTAVVGALFEERRTSALGVVALGSGSGTLVIVPLAQRWIDAWGWRDAFRGLAVVVAIGLLFACVAVLTPPERPVGSAAGMAARAS
ncbi:MAG: MFS transporter [Acidimicrobiales bacterium]